MSETLKKKFFLEKIVKYAYFYILKLITPFLLIFSPELLSWLTHFNSRIRRLPSLKERISKEKNPLDEFIFYDDSKKKFDEVNIVMRGENFENLNSSLPTFFINTYSEKKNFPNRYYATTDRLMFRAMMGKPENQFLERFNYDDPDKKFFYFMPKGPLVKENELHNTSINKAIINEKFKNIKKKLSYKLDYNLCVCSHKYDGYNIQIGSGIISVISLLNLSKKVNVYGWDAFVNKKLPKSFLQQSYKLWSPFDDFQPLSRFSAIVLNWIYAHRLINYFSTDRLIVYGRVNEVSRLEWVEKYLYKMVYKKN